MIHSSKKISSLVKGHTALVQWWASKTTLLTSTALNSATAITKILDERWLASEYTCGFEFHHYDAARNPDFLVFGETNQLNNCPKLDLPPWWSNYHQNINDLRNHIGTTSANYSVPSENWLEFDMLESELRLVGIWQTIHNHCFCHLDDWIQLSQALSCSFLSRDSLTNSTQILNFIRCFSIPTQIGLMYKRDCNIKLMVELNSKEELNRLKSYVNTIDVDAIPDLNKVVSSLIDIGPVLRPAISLDIDLREGQYNPVISFEIHQKKQIGRQLLPETKYFIEDICKISANQILSLKNTIQQLPSSVLRRRADHDGQIRKQIRIARLSHLKVTLTSDSRKLKSYVRLVEQNT